MTQDRLELVGMGRSAEIEVVGTPVQQQVTHGAAHQRQLVPASREQVSKFNGFRPNFEIHTRPFHKVLPLLCVFKHTVTPPAHGIE